MLISKLGQRGDAGSPRHHSSLDARGKWTPLPAGSDGAGGREGGGHGWMGLPPVPLTRNTGLA